MRKSAFIISLSTTVLIFCACSENRENACVNGPTYASSSRSVQALTLDTHASYRFIGDDLARQALKDIDAILNNRHHLRFAVYEYVAKNDFRNQKIVEKLGKSFLTRDDYWSYQHDINQSYTEASLLSKLDAPKEVRHRALPLEEKSYIDRATTFLKEMTTEHKHVSYFLYKKRNYFVSEQKKDTQNNKIFPAETYVEGVAIAYASAIDGWPIIGTGGKFIVRMNADAEIIGYGKFNKTPQKISFVLDSDELYTSKEALERIIQAEPSLAQAKLLRSEFGYLAHGKHSIHRYIAPHYAFAFDSPNGSKIRVRTFNAIKNEEKRKMIEDDHLADLARRHEGAENSEDVKKRTH